MKKKARYISPFGGGWGGGLLTVFPPPNPLQRGRLVLVLISIFFVNIY